MYGFMDVKSEVKEEADIQNYTTNVCFRYLDDVGLKAIYGTLFKDASKVVWAITLQNNELDQFPDDFLSQVSPFEM